MLCDKAMLKQNNKDAGADKGDGSKPAAQVKARLLYPPEQWAQVLQIRLQSSFLKPLPQTERQGVNNNPTQADTLI